MKTQKTIILLTLLAITLSSLCVVSATGKITDLRSASGLNIEQNGTITDTFNSDKPIGNITPIESVEAGEKILYTYDPNLIEDTLSTKTLSNEYIVEDSNNPQNSGIYFIFGHNGDAFMGFVPTENMGNGMLKRITEFTEVNGLIQ